MTDYGPGAGERLNKFLARAGFASRRACEQVIREGRVTISGETVTDPARRVGDQELVAVDGKPLRSGKPYLYLKFYKPRGVLTTAKDPFGRNTVMSFLKDIPARVYPVGRLDQESEGLLLLTNDGDLTYRLTHPRFRVPRIYRVYVPGRVEPEKLDRLRQGIVKQGVAYRIDSWTIRESSGEWSLVDVVLHEGKKHEVRILFDSLEHPVLRLIRLAMGPVELEAGMLPGTWKPLTEKERRAIARLMEETSIDRKQGTG